MTERERHEQIHAEAVCLMSEAVTELYNLDGPGNVVAARLIAFMADPFAATLKAGDIGDRLFRAQVFPKRQTLGEEPDIHAGEKCCGVFCQQCRKCVGELVRMHPEVQPCQCGSSLMGQPAGRQLEMAK